ncbi:MAG: HWE histidine kinase domain-containing protein [Pseudomonadota bacterium]
MSFAMPRAEERAREPKRAPSSHPRLTRLNLFHAIAVGGVLTSLIVVALFFANARAGWERLLHTTEQDLARSTYFLAEHAERGLEASVLALDQAILLTRGRDWPEIAATRALHDELAHIRDTLPQVRDLWLTDVAGRVRLTSYAFPAPEANTADRDAFQAQVPEGAVGPADDTVALGRPIVGRVTGEPSLLVSHAIPDARGRVRGVALATLSLDYLERLWADAPLPEMAQVTLFRTEDLLPLSRWPNDSAPSDEGLLAAIATRTDAGSFRELNSNGNNLVGAFAAIEGLPASLFIAVPEAVLWDVWRADQITRLPYIAAAVLALLGLTGVAAERARRGESEQRRLRDEVARQTASLRRQAKILEVVNRVSRGLVDTLDREEAVQRIVDLGTKLAGAEFGAFFYNGTDESGEEIGLYALSGAPPKAFAHFPHPRKTALFAPSFDGRAVVRSADVTQDARHGSHGGMPDGHLPVRSYLAVPVVSRSGTTHGALLFGHAEPDRFTAQYEALLVGVAAQAAVVMDNAALYAEAQNEIAARKAIEATQVLLIQELNHRVKNALATVQALAVLSARASPDLQSFQTSFTARVAALAQTQTLLSTENWRATPLKGLLRAELAPYLDKADPRAVKDGPDVLLTAEQATPFGMAIHELTTNAVKYGALSVPEGQVTVRWQIETHEGAEHLALVWCERGGPPVMPPADTGFGSELLERVAAMQLKAETAADYAPEGLTYQLRFPIAASA